MKKFFVALSRIIGEMDFPRKALLFVFFSAAVAIVIMLFLPIDVQFKIWFNIGVLTVEIVALIIYGIKSILDYDSNVTPPPLTREDVIQIFEQLMRAQNQNQAQAQPQTSLNTSTVLGR